VLLRGSVSRTSCKNNMIYAMGGYRPGGAARVFNKTNTGTAGKDDLERSWWRLDVSMSLYGSFWLGSAVFLLLFF
jgi:hypothetical protein